MKWNEFDPINDDFHQFLIEWDKQRQEEMITKLNNRRDKDHVEETSSTGVDRQPYDCTSDSL